MFQQQDMKVTYNIKCIVETTFRLLDEEVASWKVKKPQHFILADTTNFKNEFFQDDTMQQFKSAVKSWLHRLLLQICTDKLSSHMIPVRRQSCAERNFKIDFLDLIFANMSFKNKSETERWQMNPVNVLF